MHHSMLKNIGHRIHTSPPDSKTATETCKGWHPWIDTDISLNLRQVGNGMHQNLYKSNIQGSRPRVIYCS